MSDKKYDIVLFGVTGFTGRLAAEYLLQRSLSSSLSGDKDNDEYKNLKWAVSARNKSKAEKILQDIASQIGLSDDETKTKDLLPPVLTVDLLCKTDEDKSKLKDIVLSTRIVLTCSGPFELYGKTLVQLCAESGVHYADITGETDFVRGNISSLDAKARETGACIVSHCGNDCIPNDLLVFELHKFAKTNNCQLSELQTYQEFNAEASMSGGTLKTAQYQLGKNRNSNKDGTSFDPLLTKEDGTKSDFSIKNISPKGSVPVKELDGKASPWIMGPVMVNCVKRSNALLRYAPTLRYGDSQLSVAGQSWTEWGQQTIKFGVIAAAVALPSVFGGLGPKPGEGPDRETMEAGYLKLHAIGTMVSADTKDGANSDKQKERKIQGLFQFNKDTGYLYTAVLLAETGMTLLSKMKTNERLKGGCLTPASALGSDLTQRILKEMDTSLEIMEVGSSE